MYKHDFVTSQLVWKPIVVQYPTYTSVMWKPETSSTHTHTENGLFGEVGDIVSRSLTFEMNNVCIFIDSGFSNEGEVVDVVLIIFN